MVNMQDAGKGQRRPRRVEAAAQEINAVQGVTPENSKREVAARSSSAPARQTPGDGLTPEQEKLLEDGMMYVNVHSKNNPGGAVRGQLMAVK